MKPITTVLAVALAAATAGCLNKPGHLRSEKVIGGVKYRGAIEFDQDGKVIPLE